MEVVHREALFDGRVNESDVGVAAGGQGALAGVEAHQSGAVGGGNIHKAGQGHTPFGHAFAVGDAHAGFGAVVSAGNIAHRLAGDFEVPVGAVFVGRHSVEAAPGDALPQHSGVLGGFEGRVSMILHPVVLFVVVGVEAGVVVQGFAVGGDAPAAGLADGVDALAGTDMDEINRRAGPFGHPEDAAEGYILRFVAVDEGHIPPLVALLALQFFVHILHHIVVLGVDEEHRVAALDDGHQVVEVSHADLAGFAGHFGRADVGGEYFDAGPAVLDVFVEGFQGALGDVAEEHQVVGVVGIGVAAPGVGAFLDGFGDGVAGVMDGEVQQGVVPPKRAARLTCSGGAVRRLPGPIMGASMWAWGSMPPGTTTLPAASMVRRTLSVIVLGAVMATIFSPWMQTSQSPTPQGVTTWPPRIIKSSIVCVPPVGCGFCAAGPGLRRGGGWIESGASIAQNEG